LRKTISVLTGTLLFCTTLVGTAWADQTHPAVDGLKTKAAPFETKVEIQSTTQTTAPAVTEPAYEPTASTEKRIGINLASRILTVYEGNTRIAMYPVGVGQVATPSPTGNYSIQNMEVNPTWVDPDNKDTQVGSGPDNPLGYRWMGFDGTYGIHGTNRPESVGYYVSHGCIRMHEEDVEQVYDMVAVGTPVSVYYDRIVIDRDPDHTISYYIYPDGYGRQSLSVQTVKKALAGYGVEDFASPASIEAKINASDGQPSYVAKAYDLYVNGKKLAKRALGKDQIICIPAVAVATALKLDLHWSAQSGVLTSPYGTASGIVKSDVVYMDAADAYTLFHLEGMLTPDYLYEMHSVSPSQTAVVTISSQS
jgi:lipoprotein-anchoring transpeptidase ErfK/SrfK